MRKEQQDMTVWFVFSLILFGLLSIAALVGVWFLLEIAKGVWT